MHQTRLNSRGLSREAMAKRGEITLTFTVVSLVLVVLGSVLGLGVNRSQDVRTRAAGAVCGKACTSPSNCGKDDVSGSNTTCDTKLKKCVPIRMANNPACLTSGGNKLPECNEHCDNTEQCNGIDTATGISLSCDLRSHTCQQKYVNDPRQCPGYISPTPRSGGTNQSDTSFSKRALSCGAGFRVVVDPLIDSIALVGSGGTYQIGKADIVYPLGTGFNGPTDPISYRMWKPKDTDPLDNLTVEWNPSNTYSPPAGVPKGALHVQVRSGDDTNTHSQVNPQIDFYYFNNLPYWLKDGSPVRVVFKYYVLSGLQSKKTRTDTTIEVSSQACLGVPVTPSVPISSYLTPTRGITPPHSTLTPTRVITHIPTRTPTPSYTPTPFITEPGKKYCNEVCSNDSECGYNLGGGKLICRVPAGSTIKRCLLANSDSPQCYSPSSTPTRVPSATPLPTATPTRAATPTPPACSGKVTFMIDTSTTTSVTNSVKIALNQLKQWKGVDKLQYRFLVFNEKPQVVTDFTTYENFLNALNNAPSGPGTNIYAAIRKLSQLGNQANHAFIFASDGIPSFDSSNTCRYLDSQVMADVTFDPNANSSTVRSLGALSSNNCPDRKYGFPLAEIMDLIDSGNKPDPLWAINLDTQSGSNKSQRSLMNFIASKTTGKLGDENKIYETLDQATAPLCSGITTGTRAPNKTSHTLMSSFTVLNQSATKSIRSITVKACDALGSSCQDFVNPIAILPGSTGRFSQAIPASISAENRAIVTCDVEYSDGTSLACPQKATNDDGIKFDLAISDEDVSGDTLTFLQAADINNDTVVNGIDYSRLLTCLEQQTDSEPAAAACDIIADGLVNAQDISVLVERLGQRVP